MDYLENKIDKLQELLLEIARNIRSGQINGDTDHDILYQIQCTIEYELKREDD